MSGGLRRRTARTAASFAALLGLALGFAADASACARPGVRCGAPPPDQAAPAGRIVFGALGSVARMLPAQAYGVDVAGRPVTAFAQAADARLRLVVVRWTADGAVDTSFGTGDSGAGVAQLFVDLPGDAEAGTPGVTATSDGGLLVAVPMRGIATQRRIALLRLDGAGRLVAAFGTGGVVLLDGMALDAGPREIAGGAIALAGETVATAGRVVLLDGHGRPAAGFGDSGTVTVPGRPTALAGSADSLLVGLQTTRAPVRMLTLRRDGRADESAGPGGVRQAAVAGVDVTRPDTLRVGADGAVTVVGTAQRDDPAGKAGGDQLLFAARFAPGAADATATTLAYGRAGVDAVGRVLVAGFDGTQVRRYTTDGRLDRSFGRSGIAATRLPRTVTRMPDVLVVLVDGAILVGGPGTWGETAVSAFLRLRADGARDTRFGPRLLTPRQTSARLDTRNVIRLRVHCAADAQRRCVVRIRAGSRTVRAFVAPGGDRRIPVRVGKTSARRVQVRGRAIVRVRFSVIDEAVRVEVLDAPVVVRRR